MKSWLFFFSLFVGSVPCFSQVGITGVPFLQIEPTAQAVMTGGASSAAATIHPSSFFYNPAHLGQVGYQNSTSASGYYKNMDWLPTYGADLTYRHWAAAGGINLFNRLGIPLSLGIGYMRNHLNLGRQFETDDWGNITGEFSSSEHFNMVGIGLHLDLPVTVSVGYSRKNITSELNPLQDNRWYGKATAYDIGMMLARGNSYGPFHTRIATSFVLRNVGDKIQYIAESQPDPLPRKAVISYELSAAYILDFGQTTMNVLQADWTLEASDILVRATQDEYWYSTEYTRWPGNISPLKHVIMGKDDDQVTVRRGARIHLLETITIGAGKFRGPGYPEDIHTNGYTLSSDGILKMLANKSDNPGVSAISQRLTVSYSTARLNPRSFDHPLSRTRYRDISIHWKF
jgi:hypothetical protein